MKKYWEIFHPRLADLHEGPGSRGLRQMSLQEAGGRHDRGQGAVERGGQGGGGGQPGRQRHGVGAGTQQQVARVAAVQAAAAGQRRMAVLKYRQRNPDRARLTRRINRISAFLAALFSMVRPPYLEIGMKIGEDRNDGSI